MLEKIRCPTNWTSCTVLRFYFPYTRLHKWHYCHSCCRLHHTIATTANYGVICDDNEQTKNKWSEESCRWCILLL